MKHDLSSLKIALAAAPAINVKTTLARLVPHRELGASPNWLFTTGKPSRYNPAGVNCLYFSETREIAQAEYDNYLKGHINKNQPVTTYYAKVVLHVVLDLTSSKTLKVLRLDARDLFKSWRTAKYPTLTQLLGQAVDETQLFSAIRFQSKAATDRGQIGLNFVIFRNCVRTPDSVCILGPTGKPLQEWP